jgi:hypothetical protein
VRHIETVASAVDRSVVEAAGPGVRGKIDVSEPLEHDELGVGAYRFTERQYAYSASYSGNCWLMLSKSSRAIAWNPDAAA